MGKYMRKAKMTGDEHMVLQSTVGVLTRAKTLALRRRAPASNSGDCYLQLRSRRLQKSPPQVASPKKRNLKSESKQSSVPDPVSRITRETTPFSLASEADNVKAPSSSTRRTNIRSSTHNARSSGIDVLSTGDIDEIFVGAEQQQQAIFIEKYNFDVVNDLPMRGRYEWVRMSQ